jgi:hypothetical protein
MKWRKGDLIMIFASDQNAFGGNNDLMIDYEFGDTYWSRSRMKDADHQDADEYCYDTYGPDELTMLIGFGMGLSFFHKISP